MQGEEVEVPDGQEIVGVYGVAGNGKGKITSLGFVTIEIEKS